MQSLCTPYPTTKLAREADGKLVDDIAKAVVTHTFVAHTAADLSDEEMELIPHPSHFGHVRCYFQPLGHSFRGSCCPTCMIPARWTPIGEMCRKHGRHTSTGGPTPHRAPFAGLAHIDLVRTAALANLVWLAITAPMSYNRSLCQFTSWFFTCKQLKALAHTLFRTDRSTISLVSLRETAANIT